MVLNGSSDGFDDVKLTVVTALTGVVAWQAVRRSGRQRLIGRGTAAVVGAFALAAVWATITSDQPVQSLFGAHERHNGLATYLVLTVLLLLAASILSIQRLAQCAQALAMGAALAVAYWLLTLAGPDPLGVRPPPDLFSLANPFSSTLGNPNFAGAFVAAALPAAVWASLRSGLSRCARAGWLAVTGLLAAGIIGSDALQAPLAGAAGLAVLALAAAARRSRRATRTVVTGCLIGILLTAAGLARLGPLAGLGAQETFAYRTWDWTAAVRMTRDHPLTGVGLARYGGYMRAYRPADQPGTYGWELYDDTPHSVPLDLAAGGGLPLLCAYLALAGLTGWRLLSGLLHHPHRKEHWLLAAWGGVWAAYQAQALVSIDVPRLSTLHFLSAGAILALTAPSARPHAAPTHGQRRLIATRISAISVAAMTLFGVVTLTRQVAAEYYLGRSRVIEHADPHASLRAASRSVRAFPWRPAYWSQLGAAHTAARQPAAALEAYLHAVHLDPREVFRLLTAAHAAEDLGKPELAAALLRQAVHVEPHATELKLMAAVAAHTLGRTQEALDLIHAALAFAPDDARALRLLGELGRGR